jgi:hypothetical protein
LETSVLEFLLLTKRTFRNHLRKLAVRELRSWKLLGTKVLLLLKYLLTWSLAHIDSSLGILDVVVGQAYTLRLRVEVYHSVWTIVLHYKLAFIFDAAIVHYLLGVLHALDVFSALNIVVEQLYEGVVSHFCVLVLWKSISALF